MFEHMLKGNTRLTCERKPIILVCGHLLFIFKIHNKFLIKLATISFLIIIIIIN